MKWIITFLGLLATTTSHAAVLDFESSPLGPVGENFHYGYYYIGKGSVVTGDNVPTSRDGQVLKADKDGLTQVSSGTWTEPNSVRPGTFVTTYMKSFEIFPVSDTGLRINATYDPETDLYVYDTWTLTPGVWQTLSIESFLLSGFPMFTVSGGDFYLDNITFETRWISNLATGNGVNPGGVVTYGTGPLRFNPNPSPSTAPEPDTWLSLIAGFGMVGAAMRRRKVDGQDVVITRAD